MTRRYKTITRTIEALQYTGTEENIQDAVEMDKKMRDLSVLSFH